MAVDTLLKEVVGNMQLVAEAKSIELSLMGESSACVPADATQLRRVFYNLLDNAIKYTPARGTVIVRNDSVKEGIVVSIQDSGIGIAAEHLPRVFDRFYRVDPARVGETGTGLGLALCQSIISGIGGSIVLESRLGEGTKVSVTLPK